MTVPGALYLECETCNEVTLQEVVHGKVSKTALEVNVRCRECGTTTQRTIKETQRRKVPVVVSEGAESSRRSLEIEVDDVLCVGDELLVDGIPVQVRAIEVGHEDRVEAAPVAEIETLWTVRFDRIKVRFSVNLGARTKTSWEVAAPDEEFTIGEMVEVAGVPAVIHRIKAKDSLVRRGSVEARNISRIYCRAVRGHR
jgi:uncharacterized Zn finger protein